MFADASFWVAVSFVLFILLLMYFRVPKMVTDALDARSAAIAAELDEAQRLREEAQALLANYQRKQRDAEKEAEEIVQRAEADAKRLAEETREILTQQMQRRMKQAEEKIAQAEAQALKEVQNLTTDIAIESAREVIAGNLDSRAQETIANDGIRDLRARLS